MKFRQTFRHGLYDETFERDACGIGLIANAEKPPERSIVTRALTILSRLAHRSALGADGRTSDGAGILLQIPDRFFRASGFSFLPERGAYAVAQIFAPRGFFSSTSAHGEFEAKAKELGIPVLAWREVPVDSDYLGLQAKCIEPEIYQVFLDFRSAERKNLFLLRSWAERKFRQYSACRDPQTGETLSQFYICSLSAETIVYKGLMRPQDLGLYYRDLQNPEFASQFALVHSRFSTNTLPAWELAQPFRYCCHNGEINTIKANRIWMRARERDFQIKLGLDEASAPVLSEGRSDSANFDEAFEALVLSGATPPKAMMTMVPEPWETDQQMDQGLRSFYEQQALAMEPWDGPAALCFADGRYVGASLDRNGLRPCRYQILKDGTLIAGSEAGAVEVPPAEVKIKARLKPGQLLCVNLQTAEIDLSGQVKHEVARGLVSRKPLEILGGNLADLRPPLPTRRGEALWTDMVRFGYHYDEVQQVLLPMFVNKEEATSSMGVDIPLALLSERPQLLTSYFRQLFAQVTNPPIDPIREKSVMSLTTYLGSRASPFSNAPDHCQRWLAGQPFLTSLQFAQLQSWLTECRASGLRTAVLDGTFSLADGDFERAIESLCEKAEVLAQSGHEVLILSDRRHDQFHAAIPSVLLVSAVHTHLIKRHLRMGVSLVVETAEARDVHQMACLLSFGADAVHPYLVEELCRELAQEGILPVSITAENAIDNYYAALTKGLLKILSKLGISALQSYRGAQTFELLGLGRDLVERYFSGAISRIGGLGLEEMVEEVRRRWQNGDACGVHCFAELSSLGNTHFRSGGETHHWNPNTISKLQQAAGKNDSRTYREFSAAVLASEKFTLRGHMHFRKLLPAIPLSEVEPASEIVKRFTTGAMSLGALSIEAHETLALAMNRIGGKSNSGEGGEDAVRFLPLANGDSKNSKIKQIASARFGVTIEYLNSASEIQIKMAQGAKPGEGGQLPGHKVDSEIARLRHSTSGVTLISPPPHHDIYSIEDLAQLIYDLKCANPAAVISVKLVSEAGVGTVAAGVAKAMAEKILISGDGGGTGASPLSSIHHAGLPWELGLAETQQTLVMNGLRSRVKIEVDGQLRTGRDVAKAALLGAEEFGFATAPLIVEGCLMMRKCHLNTCPVGVATQDPVLRRKFAGQPEHVINYFFFVAEEVRELMSELGVRTVAELVGRTEFLEFVAPEAHWKAGKLDLSTLLEKTRPAHFRSHKIRVISPELDQRLLLEPKADVQNINRSVGCWLSGDIVRNHSSRKFNVELKGSAGQSFGAFLTKGVTLSLTGEANDYVGKGLSGGKLVLRFDPTFTGDHSRSVIAGNTCLYGATSGSAYFAGTVGERFAVRNSGAEAVVEGLGDHGCEYMTGGLVLVLGATGKNFAAGMSGGVAYVCDEDQHFISRCNTSSVEIEALDEKDEREVLRLLTEHLNETGSGRAAELIKQWKAVHHHFRKVMPRELKSVVLKRQQEAETV